MANYSEAGKGSKQRPTDQDAYAKGWDLIFNKNSFGKKESEKQENQSEENKSERS